MKYDIAIIGGGPAGMIAAIHASELGARVILLEKNDRLGVKLLLTGGGRCNITNKTEDIREFINQFGKDGKFLFSALNKFGVNNVIDFFENRGVKTKVEEKNRVFPKSNSAVEILKALIKALKEQGVEIKTNAEVKNIVSRNNKIEKIILVGGEEIEANRYIICTGGKSYPETGSSGDALKWLKKLGHTIVGPWPALVPIIIKETFVKRLEGLSLKDAKIILYKDNKKVNERQGEAIFTATGMSGPIILNLSKDIAINGAKNFKISIDFKPAQTFGELDLELQDIFRTNGNKLFKNIFDNFLPPKFVPVLTELAKINPEKKVNIITGAERTVLVNLIKNFVLEIKGTEKFEKAITTAGGVNLAEVDPRSMKSKIVDNLYFAGEIVGLAGPTGGYNLQACWSTGYLAGESAAKG